MSSGDKHDRATLNVSLGIFGLALFLRSSVYSRWLFCAAVGSLAGLVLSPDLDTHSNSTKRWKSVGLGFVWWAYDTAIPHRSWVSHGPFIGTFLRILYLIGMYVLLVHLSYWLSLQVDFVSFAWEPDETLGRTLKFVLSIPIDMTLSSFVGLCLSDVIHIIMDVSSTADKKFKRSQKYGKKNW